MMSNKLLIVTPYRDRAEHLKQFLPYITNTLKNQNIEYKIVIVEQSQHKPFNRGLICNIGFSLFYKDYDYVCFHDVDMLCSTIDYSYSNNPCCLLRHRGKFDNVYDEYFGGITIFPNHLFLTINGFSNEYWGWGCEDDDLRIRCLKHNIDVSNRDGYCHDLELITDDTNRINNINYNNNFKRLIYFRDTLDKNYTIIDGISTIQPYFNLQNIINHKTHTQISVII